MDVLINNPIVWGALLFAVIVIAVSIARVAFWGLLLLALPIYIIMVTLWPGYWLIHVVFLPLFLIGIILWMFSLKVIGRVLVALGLVATLVVGAISFLNDNPSILGAVSCDKYHYALDITQTISNPEKEVEFAVGTPVVQRDEAGIKSELQERRSCGADGKFDPTLLAQHFAEWSYQGFVKENPISFADVDAFAAQLVADGNLYATTLATVEELENTSVFSTEAVGAGLWSLYVVPDGLGGITTHQGQTSNSGTAAVFTRDGKAIKYRLECGFQVLHEGDNPPGLPPIECPPGYTGEWPICKDPASNDPAAQGNAPEGGGLNEDPGPGTYIAPEDMEQPPADPYVAPPAPPAPAPPAPPAPPADPPPPPVETGSNPDDGTGNSGDTGGF